MTDSLPPLSNLRLRSVFDAALDLEPAAREAYVARECGDDRDLLTQVRRLLRAQADAESFLEVPPGPIQVVAAPLLAGRRVGPYELEREIGRGGMGVVYLARRIDGQFDREVAVKMIPTSVIGHHAEQRFRQERHILATLEHPHIAQLFDAGTTDDGMSYVVMEYVKGEPINRYCERRQLSIAARLDLVAAVCETVQFAHRHLVVHRDLKPSNIFVTDAGAIKLLDFGIAKLLDPTEEATDNTRTGAQPMTPAYASPEQVLGERVTTATDVYALGLLLYELLTGYRAHELRSPSLEEIVRVVCQTEPLRPSAIVDRDTGGTSTAEPRGPQHVGLTDSPARVRRLLSGDLDTIVMTALRREPERRYPGAAELAQDLRRYRGGRPIAAQPDTWTYRASKFARRNAVPIAGVAAVFAALAVALVVTLWQAREAERARREAEAQRGRAEQRFNDVRTLATGFVFEFHDAIATLAGATPARQLVVSKGVEYLDILAKDATGDRSLQRDLADAYDRIALIQSSPYESNVGDSSASLISAQKAIALREALAADTEPGSADRQAAIAAYLRLGDARQSAGRTKEAIDAYRQVINAAESTTTMGSWAPTTTQHVAAAANRLCGILLAVGDGAGALTHCDKSVSLYAGLLATDPANAALREAAAGSHVSRANALRINGRAEEALSEITRGSAGLREVLSSAPSNARVQLNLAVALMQQALVQLPARHEVEAVASNLEAVTLLDTLHSTDPTNARVSSLLSFLLLRQAPLLVRVGRAMDAAASTRRGLDMLRADAERPDAGPARLNDYAFWLLTCEPASERRPAVALRFARRASADEPTSLNLDTLALALFHTGDATAAIKTGEAALAQLPPLSAGSASTGLRAEIEGHLAEFRAAAQGVVRK